MYIDRSRASGIERGLVNNQAAPPKAASRKTIHIGGYIWLDCLYQDNQPSVKTTNIDKVDGVKSMSIRSLSSETAMRMRRVGRIPGVSRSNAATEIDHVLVVITLGSNRLVIGDRV
jgi:hypothetical protein